MAADLGKYQTIQPKARHVFECLKVIQEAKTEEEKIQLVKIHLADNLPFKHLMMWGLLSRIKSILPDGPSPYIKNDSDGDVAKIWEFLKMFPYFVESTRSLAMQKLKIERLYLDMMEAIPAEEAELVDNVKDKKPFADYPGVYPWLFYKADPETFFEHSVRTVPTPAFSAAKVKEEIVIETPSIPSPVVNDLEISNSLLETDEESLKSFLQDSPVSSENPIEETETKKQKSAPKPKKEKSATKTKKTETPSAEDVVKSENDQSV